MSGNHNKALAERRAYNDAYRASLPPSTKYGGPRIDVFFEGWALVGWGFSNAGHYWRRRSDDQLLALCGLHKPIERTNRGQLMIFEVGNYSKCKRCERKRRA
jgi:hypothetical protein